jgi:outer membrane protein assembly factor BamE
MTKSQVRDILGTPLLASVFHADRWDFAFTFYRQGAEPQSRHFAVYFKGDALDHFDAADLPREAEFVASLKSIKDLSKVPAMEATPERLQAYVPHTPAAAPPAMLPITAVASYPPLEAPKP